MKVERRRGRTCCSVRACRSAPRVVLMLPTDSPRCTPLNESMKYRASFSTESRSAPWLRREGWGEVEEGSGEVELG